jgi:hypothetical protein
MKITYYIKSSKSDNTKSCLVVKKGLFTTHYAYSSWGEHNPNSSIITEVVEWEDKKFLQWIVDQGYTYQIPQDEFS